MRKFIFKGMNAIYKKMMLDIYNAQLFERETYDGIKYLKNVNWEKINEILSQCSQWKHYCDEYDYHNLSFSNGTISAKLEGILHFVERYGSKTAYKILREKLELK